ncbi:unnamed protein product [Rotaria sp. Silwood2]|nr:unnamed protein product [Rotaria sp. Silwood2]CAF4658815.1 unnamed protein product [Rotaria sp. Silwood2]
MYSTQDDDIIEISNPSDASFLTQFDPLPLNDSISILPKNTLTSKYINSSSSSNLNKRYASKFKKELLSNSRFSIFLRECKSDPAKALCIVCNIQFSIQNSGLGDINHHFKTRKHQESKTVDTIFQIPTSELNKSCTAEGTMVFHGVTHSHSYNSQACTINITKKCFPDSSIAKNITCGRTKVKVREIACNVLAPSLTYSVVLELRDFGVKHGIIEFIEQQKESADALFTNMEYVLEANELKLNQIASLGSDNTNVNIGNNHSVFSLFNKVLPRLIKGKKNSSTSKFTQANPSICFRYNCYSHILHNSVKHGNGYLLFDVEAALLKIYAHFCRSSFRSQELEKYFDFVEQEQKVILKHIRLRWLSLSPSIERLIVVHPVIKNYFLNLEDNECPSLLLDFFTTNEENQLIRCAHLWYLLDDENVPNLQKLVQCAFSIPASNAFCESVFSHMKYLWDNNRNQMKHDLVGAEFRIKMNTHYTCTQFYGYLLKKPDLLKQIRSSDKYSHVAKVPRIV